MICNNWNKLILTFNQEEAELGDVHQFDNNEFDEASKVLKEVLKLKARCC